MSELADLIDKHSRSYLTETALPGLMVSRSSERTEMAVAVPPPLLCVIAQGRKRIVLGNDALIYDPETYLVTSADLPVSGQVIDAPMLGLSLALDPTVLAEILVSSPGIAQDRGAAKAMAVSRLDAGLLDAVIRLLRLLDQPEHLATLGPLIQREILYRLLLGPKGAMLRQMALPTSRLSQISKTINFIRRRFDQPIRVEELADLASMSSPSFHRHFRAVTGMSPLQFQKRIRLQEARRRLLSENQGASSVAMEVGYESPSQFSREYRRMFGAPPSRETNLARGRPQAQGLV